MKTVTLDREELQLFTCSEVLELLKKWHTDNGYSLDEIDIEDVAEKAMSTYDYPAELPLRSLTTGKTVYLSIFNNYHDYPEDECLSVEFV